MMEEMKSKAIAEKDKEIKLFKEYMSWCKDTTTDKKHEIITATDEIGRLEATIMKSDVAAKELSDKVKAIDEDIAMWSQDKDAATEVREKEQAEISKIGKINIFLKVAFLFLGLVLGCTKTNFWK